MSSRREYETEERLRRLRFGNERSGVPAFGTGQQQHHQQQSYSQTGYNAAMPSYSGQHNQHRRQSLPSYSGQYNQYQQQSLPSFSGQHNQHRRQSLPSYSGQYNQYQQQSLPSFPGQHNQHRRQTSPSYSGQYNQHRQQSLPSYSGNYQREQTQSRMPPGWKPMGLPGCKDAPHYRHIRQRQSQTVKPNTEITWPEHPKKERTAQRQQVWGEGVDEDDDDWTKGL